MRDPDYDPETETVYECMDCGERVASKSHPGPCPECGAAVRNQAMPME